MSGRGCHSEECHQLHGWFLGATDEDYIAKDVANLQFAQHDAWLAVARASVAAEQITAGFLASQCGGVTYQGPPMSLTALKDGSLALGIAVGAGVGTSAGAFGTGVLAVTGAASTAIAAATFGIGAAVAIYSIIQAHHAAAVAREQALECKMVPPANYALQLIEQAVMSGQMTPEVGSASLDRLHSDFVSTASGGPGGLEEHNAQGNANAMAMFAHILQAIIDKKKDKYAAMAAQATTQIVAARPNVTSPAGVVAPVSSYASFYGAPAAAPKSSSDWLPIAALLFAGFFFLRSA